MEGAFSTSCREETYDKKNNKKTLTELPLRTVSCSGYRVVASRANGTPATDKQQEGGGRGCTTYVAGRYHIMG